MADAGAPIGNKNASKNKPWADALRKELDGEVNAKKLRRLARKTIAMGLEGEMSAIKEIGDRLDGKPVQGLEGKIDHDHTGTITHEHKDGMNFTEIQEKRQKLRVIQG